MVSDLTPEQQRAWDEIEAALAKATSLAIDSYSGGIGANDWLTMIGIALARHSGIMAAVVTQLLQLDDARRERTAEVLCGVLRASSIDPRKRFSFDFHTLLEEPIDEG